MSISNKPGKGAATTTDDNWSENKPVTVLDIIKSKIQSEFLPTKTQYVLYGKDEKPQSYRAEFTFEGNLRRYLSLQNQAAGKKNKFSNLISFTSAGSGADALALPCSVYVRDTWGRDGAKILQIIDQAMGGAETREVSASESKCVPGPLFPLR